MENKKILVSIRGLGERLKYLYYVKVTMKNNLKRLYDSLNYYAKYKKKEIIKNKEEDEGSFRNSVPDKIEKLLYQYKYISNDEEECFDPLYMITQNGNEFLMKLDNIFYKDWKFYIAIGTAIATLGRLFGWW